MEGAEHAWIGDQITLRFRESESPSPETLLEAGAGKLTYGRLIALGGDFYGVVGRPISTDRDPRSAFMAAFDSLRTAWNQVDPILRIMDEEIAAVDKARQAGREPSIAYAALGDSLSKRWNRVTGGGSPVTDLVPMGRYLKLAAENWDHFTHYAIRAYRAGHEAAMQAATLAGEKGGNEAALRAAYAMNAFADHFLTDLFSSGHLRAPRKELYDQVTTPIPGFSGSLGSLLVRCMHDEDCDHGLRVTNGVGDSWIAFGDKRLLDSVSADNRAMVVRAVQASADDVWRAYEGGAHEYRALQLVPDLERVNDVGRRENFSPLFLMKGDTVARRNDVANRDDYSWTTDWWGWSTYYKLLGTRSYHHAKCYTLSSGAFVGWLSSSPLWYACVVPDEAKADGVCWDIDGNSLYLRRDSSPADRFFGLSDRSYAGWGVRGPAGWWNPVTYNADLTVSLKEHPERKLYLYKNKWLCWSEGASHPDLIRIDLPMTTPSPGC